MISEALWRGAEREPSRGFLSGIDGELSYSGARERTRALTDALAWAKGARIGVSGDASQWAALHLLALERIGARPYLLPPDLDASAREALAERVGLHAVLLPGEPGSAAPARPPLEPVAAGEVVLFTSGTTALPKAALHSWRSLAARVRVAPDVDGARWLLTYALSAFAGLQVFLHALLNAGRITLGHGSPAAMAEQAARDGVSHLSGTPTFFRFLLSGAAPEALARIPLRQLTLGGEPVDQPILDALRARFPAARLTHIYASTEMGACFSVNDGQAGFPASYLENEELPVRLRVVDGELWIRSPHRMRAYLAGEEQPVAGEFFRTGDVVEVRGARVHFLGRRSERINVGGRKVYPREVEEAVLEVPGVRAVRVAGTASSLVGQLVAAEVVAEPGADRAGLRGAILAHCRGRLPAFKVPRRLTFVDSLAGTASGKLVRK